AAPTPAASAAPAASSSADANGVRASPVGRNVAQEHGLDLSKVPGSGAQGRVTKADVTNFLEKGATSSQQSEMQPPLSTFPGQKAPSAAPPAQTQPPVATPYYSQPPPPSMPGGTYSGFGPISISLRAYKPPRYTPKDGDQVVP